VFSFFLAGAFIYFLARRLLPSTKIKTRNFQLIMNEMGRVPITLNQYPSCYENIFARFAGWKVSAGRKNKTKAPEMILMKIMICRNMVLKINLV
jgi:hypothetical protein